MPRLFAALATALLAAGVHCSPAAAAPQNAPNPKIPEDARAAIDHAKSLSKAFRAISKIAAPSVVSIETRAAVRAQNMPGMPGMFSPRMMPGPMQQVRGEGTGFIISDEGHIATNNHVVRGASQVVVHLHDGREAAATLVGTDAETDIAVLKIDLPNLEAISFGDSDAAEVGDWVVAFGSPFGLKDSVTAGIISAKGREVGLSPLESYLQTDATINPGNSGGPLVDLEGRVIGMNTAIESRSGGSDGIGFAIPSNLAKSVVESIIAGSSPTRGFLGVQLQPLDPNLAESFAFEGEGVLVNTVVPDGPADRAGVQPGDIIVKVNGAKTPSVHSVQRAVRLCKPGADCPVEIFRDGATRQVNARLDDSTRQVASAAAPAPTLRAAPRVARPADTAALGLEVKSIDAAYAKERGLRDTSGALVASVAPASPAARAGLRPGDIVRQVGGEAVVDAEGFTKQLASAAGNGRSVRMLVERDGAAKFVLLRGT
ncbi:MAG: trypsin-like peptidase domain-containing protein [Phycisphaerales bacterium]